MFRKLTLAAAVGTGYVLGAKAGRERYEQIMSKYRELAGKPAVQEFTSNVSQTASTVADKAKGTVNEKVSSGSSSSSPSTQPAAAGLGTPLVTDPLVTDPTPVVTTTPMPGAGPSVTAPDTF